MGAGQGKSNDNLSIVAPTAQARNRNVPTEGSYDSLASSLHREHQQTTLRPNRSGPTRPLASRQSTVQNQTLPNQTSYDESGNYEESQEDLQETQG